MKIIIRVCLLLTFTFVVVFVGLTWKTNFMNSQSVKNEGNMEREKDQSKKTTDPCWFARSALLDSVESEMKKKYWDRKIYGYFEGVSLKEAVTIFNEEENCFPYSATLLPLTEEEVISAIISGPDYGSEGDLWLTQKGDLFEIASRNIMPKGSLLAGSGGVRLPDSPLKGAVGKGRKIYLFLGLDKNPRQSNQLKREQIFLIRKTFFNVEDRDKSETGNVKPGS